MRILRSQTGFTLIEVMITVAILAVLTVLTAQSIQQAAKAKLKIQDQIDSVSQVRDIQRLIEKDISLAFHYIDIEKEMAEAVQKAKIEAKKKAATAKKKSSDDVPVSEGAPPPEVDNAEDTSGATDRKYPAYFKTENRVDPTTQFSGKESEINFVTQNIYRMQKDVAMADFGEVGYFLDSCIGSGPGEGKCLFRRFSPFVDKDVTRGGYKSQMLRNVTEFKLKYYSKVKKDWTNEFKSGEGGESFSNGRYPEAVELTLTVEQPPPPTIKGAKAKKVSIQVVIPIRNPNNPDAKKGNPNGDSEGEGTDVPPEEGVTEGGEDAAG